jgi:hypothetical protein
MKTISRKDAKAQRTLLALVLLVLLTPLFAHSQGCAMCYTAAAAQSDKGKHALDAGILMLLTPAIGLFCGFVVLARKHRAWWEKE